MQIKWTKTGVGNVGNGSNENSLLRALKVFYDFVCFSNWYRCAKPKPTSTQHTKDGWIANAEAHRRLFVRVFKQKLWQKIVFRCMTKSRVDSLSVKKPKTTACMSRKYAPLAKLIIIIIITIYTIYQFTMYHAYTQSSYSTPIHVVRIVQPKHTCSPQYCYICRFVVHHEPLRASSLALNVDEDNADEKNETRRTKIKFTEGNILHFRSYTYFF